MMGAEEKREKKNRGKKEKNLPTGNTLHSRLEMFTEFLMYEKCRLHLLLCIDEDWAHA